LNDCTSVVVSGTSSGTYDGTYTLQTAGVGVSSYGYWSGSDLVCSTWNGISYTIFTKPGTGTKTYAIVYDRNEGTYNIFDVAGGSGTVFCGGMTNINNQITISIGYLIGNTAYPGSYGSIELDYSQCNAYSQPTPTPTLTPTSTPSTTPTNTPTPSTTPPASGTSEAETYLAAVIAGGGTGITSTESGATITLFTSLVSNNLWDKLDIFYPLIGGNAGGCAVNGKNPGTYDLTFSGGPTFSTSGMTGDGIDACANTGYRDNNTLQNDFHMAVYTNIGTSNTSIDCGVASVSANSRSSIYVREVNTAGFAAHRVNSGYVSFSSTGLTGTGLYVANRTSSTNEEGYINGMEVTSATTTSVATVGLPYVLGARYGDSGPEAYSNRRYCWFSVGKSFTDSQQATFSSIINTFQTSLGRNTY
jgi:hypothetical protein